MTVTCIDKAFEFILIRAVLVDLLLPTPKFVNLTGTDIYLHRCKTLELFPHFTYRVDSWLNVGSLRLPLAVKVSPSQCGVKKNSSGVNRRVIS